MKILGLLNKDSGSGFHRVMMPLLMMDGPDCKITNTPTLTDIDNCDILFYNKAIGDHFQTYAKWQKKKIVVDVDDYWELDYSHPEYENFIENNFKSVQLYHIEQADLVITTHERLAAKIRPYNGRVIICPNSIPQHNYFKIERTESTLPRIFWQGGIHHERDIELLRNPFKRLSNCATIIAGYTANDPNDKAAWDRMVSSFTNGLKLPGGVLPGTSPMDYYKNYGIADICVAPLLPTRFNSMKSNLKVLEAANVACPIVCSKVDPYLDLPVLYAEKQTDWYKHLNMLIHDKDARIELGERLQDYFDDYYNYTKINQLRYDRFNSLTATLPEREQGALRHAGASAVHD